MFAKFVIVTATGLCVFALGMHTPMPKNAAGLKHGAMFLKAGKGRAAGKTRQRAPALVAPAALAAADPDSGATLTKEQSAALDKAAACYDDADASVTQVEAAVDIVNETANKFLEAVTSAVKAAQENLAKFQDASDALQAAGMDENFITDTVNQLNAKATDVLTVLNKTNEDLKTSLSSVVDQYREEGDKINESLTEAIAATREGLLADAAKAEAEAAANISAMFLIAMKVSEMGPKSTATKAITKINATADESMEMLASLNTTLLEALMGSAVDNVNSTAHQLQDALVSAEAKFPDTVPSSVTDKVNSIFDAVFAAIEAVKPTDVNNQIAPKIQEASADMANLQTCIAPLADMVEDMDGAGRMSGSWAMLSVLIGIALSSATQR